jgi:methanogenic corrinoid protein MtbC1
MAKEFKIDTQLNEKLHAKSIELSGLERLIGFSMADTDYQIPEEKIEKLMQKHAEANAVYEELKSEVNKIVADKFGANSVWSLDFLTGIVTVTE